MSDQIVFFAEQERPEIAPDDIKVQVANVDNVPQAKLDRFQENASIQSTIEGVDVSYLTKFVLSYQDSYEKFDKWHVQEDIGLL